MSDTVRLQGLRARLVRRLRPDPAPPAQRCPDCGTEAEGVFCPACGMDKRSVRLDLRVLLARTADSVVGADSTLGRTLLELLRRPGELVRDYAAGRRRTYLNPARFALLTLALWILLTRMAGLDPLEASGIRITNKSGDQPELVENARAFFGRNLDLFLYLTLPLRALLLSVLFRGSGRNLAESLALVLYVAGLGYLVGTVLIPLDLLGVPNTAPVRIFVTFLWTARAARVFYDRSWLGTGWRVALVALLHPFATALLFLVLFALWFLVLA